MDWSAFFWYGMDPLVVLEDTLNGPQYRQLLGDDLHPILAFKHPDDLAVFQDDNAPPHCSNVAREGFEEHAGEVQRMSWPSRSPDINPNEHIWDAVELRFRALESPPTNRPNWFPLCRLCGVNFLRKCTRDLQTHFHSVWLSFAGPEGDRPDIK